MKREIIDDVTWEQILADAMDDDHRAELREWRVREALEVLVEEKAEAERERVKAAIALAAGVPPADWPPWRV